MPLPNERLEQVIAALVMRLGGRVCLSNEEIEDACQLEVRSLFLTDEIELKARGEFRDYAD